MEHNSSLVNLSIPENVTRPIIAAKIQEAITIAMGGADKIVAGVVHQICNTKVNPKDGKVSDYSSNNTMLWMDYHVTTLLQSAISEEVKKQLIEIASPVREALVKDLQTKKGASKIANALLSSMAGEANYEIKFSLQPKDSKNSNGW